MIANIVLECIQCPHETKMKTLSFRKSAGDDFYVCNTKYRPPHTATPLSSSFIDLRYLNDSLAGNYALQLYLAQNQSWINKCFPKQVEEVETYATSRPARYRLLTYVLLMNVFHFGQFDMLWARKCLFTMIFTIVMLTLAWSKMTKQTGDYQLIDKRLLDQSSVSRLTIWPILIACLFSYA